VVNDNLRTLARRPPVPDDAAAGARRALASLPGRSRTAAIWFNYSTLAEYPLRVGHPLRSSSKSCGASGR
jgi:hypothetical protein